MKAFVQVKTILVTIVEETWQSIETSYSDLPTPTAYPFWRFHDSIIPDFY